jgi:hypothetical protein
MLERLRVGLPQWGISGLVHVLLLLVLAVFHVDAGRTPRVVSVLSDLEDLNRAETFLDRLEEIDLTAPVSLANTGAGTPSEQLATEMLASPLAANDQTSLAQAATNRSLIRPLSQAIGKLSLSSTIPGLKGASSMAAGDEGMGAVDQVTREIIRQLESSRVLVAWVLDCTRSLEKRREAIAQRIDRIYHEINELGVQKEDAILTAVVSFGNGTRFMLERPAADAEAIRKAIRAIRDDESGTENVFAAIRETALKYRRYQTAGARRLMIIVVTDETGDDGAMVDDTTALLIRNRVPAYVLGPMATFSRNTVEVPALNLETKELFIVPINRGPASRRDEVLRVPFNTNTYASGYGPFGLSQVALETGGIYFIYDDGLVRGPIYDPEILMRYKPDYGAKQEYASLVGESPLRRALMEVVEEGNSLWNAGFPNGAIPASNWKEAVDGQQKAIAPFITFADKSVAKLNAVSAAYVKEPSLHWRANFALTYARLIQARVRSEEFAWALADFKRDPPVLKDPKNNNGWQVQFVDFAVGGTTPTTNKSGKESGSSATKNKVAPGRDPKSIDQARKWAEDSRAWYQKTVQEHSGTVWAEAARTEMRGAVAARIIEVKFPPMPTGKPPKGKPPRI